MDKPENDDEERVSLAPLDPRDALRGLLQVDPADLDDSEEPPPDSEH